MRPIDETGRLLCEIQARLFEKSLSYFSGSSPIFIRRFLYSEVATHISDGTFLFLNLSDEGVFAALDQQFGPSHYGSTRYEANALYWAGYLYAYWAYTEETPMKRLLSLCPSSELISFYEPLHSEDPGAAIRSIKEAKGLKEVDLQAETVRLLKKLHAQKKE